MSKSKQREIEKAIHEGRRLAFRLKEVSDLVGIPVSTLRKMVRSGELNPCVGFRNTWLILAEDLQRLLDQRLR